MNVLKSSICCGIGLIVALASFTGCQNKSENSVKSQVYVYGTAQEPGTLNPDAQDEPYGFSIYQNIYSRLVKCTNNFDIVPDLAESWEFSNDGTKLTFNLRDNVKWHDGVKFTSSDVKWTFDTILESHGYMEGALSSIDSIECIDDTTVVFNLSNPDSSIMSSLSRLGVFIMPEHIYSGSDWMENDANFKPVGTGPFVFEEWVSGESIRLKKNSDYFVIEPKLDEVVFKFIPDENTAFLAWKNGEIDWYDSYPAEEVEKLKGNDDYVVVDLPTANVTYVTFNTKCEPFNDPAVRKAFSLAVDRDEIIDKAFSNVGNKAEYYLPSIYSDYLNPGFKVPEKNVEEAKRLLDDAGYKIDDDGYYLSVDFEYFSLDNFEDTAILLENQLEEIGINLNLNLVEYATWQEKVFNNRDFKMTLMNGNQKPSVFSTIDRYNPDSATCISGYDSDEMRDAVSIAVKTMEKDDTISAFSDIQKLLSEDLIIIPIAEKVDQIPLKANVHGHPLNDSISIASSDELTYVYFS